MNYIKNKINNIFSDTKILTDNIAHLDSGDIQNVKTIKNLLNIVLNTHEMKYEYGVADKRVDIDGIQKGVCSTHREGMTKEEAEEWLRECEEMGLNVFKMIRRPVGEWEVVE